MLLELVIDICESLLKNKQNKNRLNNYLEIEKNRMVGNESYH